MPHMIYTPDDEIQSRIHLIQTQMQGRGYDGLLVVHHTNLFYCSGTSQNAYLFIPQNGHPLLMVKKSYERAVRESSIKHIVRITGLKQIFPLIRDHLGREISGLGLELDVIPYNTVLFYQNRLFPGIELFDASKIIKQVRQIKSEYEIGLLRHSCKVLDSAFSNVPGFIYPGITEIELAALFEAHLRKNGYGGGCKMRAFNQDFMFGNIVSGASGRQPSYFDGPVCGQGVTPANNPHGAGWKKIQKDEAVYIDYTCVINGYTADAERIFVMGRLDDTLKRAHTAALTIQDELTKMIKPGVRCSKIWEMSVKIAADEGLLNHYMGSGDDQVKFVGHGVGLELDELPVFAKGFDLELRPGMTFALEPKFVFDHGAVGIENTFAVTENGVEKLNLFSEDICYI